MTTTKKKQLPWRTLVEIPEGQTGRFTRQQIREAVLAVKAEREAREARARGRKQVGQSASATAEMPERKKRAGVSRRAA